MSGLDCSIRLSRFRGAARQDFRLRLRLKLKMKWKQQMPTQIKFLGARLLLSPDFWWHRLLLLRRQRAILHRLGAEDGAENLAFVAWFRR